MSYFSHITLIQVREINPARLFHPARLLDTQECVLFTRHIHYSFQISNAENPALLYLQKRAAILLHF